MLVVEDLHWADPSSLDALTWLINKLPTLPIALVATYRTSDLDREHPLRRVLLSLDHHPSVTRLQLGRRAAHDVGVLASSMPGASADLTWVDEVHRRSEGNAFFAEELLSVGPATRLSDSLHDVLMSRVHVAGSGAAPGGRAHVGDGHRLLRGTARRGARTAAGRAAGSPARPARPRGGGRGA